MSKYPVLIKLLRQGYTHKQIADKLGWTKSTVKTTVKELRKAGHIPKSQFETQEIIDNYWLYIIQCENDNYYVGITNDLNRRMAEHWDGVGAIFTKEHKPVSVPFAMQQKCTLKTIQKTESYVQWNVLLKNGLIHRDQKFINKLKQIWMRYGEEGSDALKSAQGQA